MVEDIRRIVRASIGNRAKEGLLVEFIHQTDLTALADTPSIIEAFYIFADHERKRDVQALIDSEKLNVEATERYLQTSLTRGVASDNGTELNEILPKMSPLNPHYLTKKQTVFDKISQLVEKFKGTLSKGFPSVR